VLRDSQKAIQPDTVSPYVAVHHRQHRSTTGDTIVKQLSAVLLMAAALAAAPAQAQKLDLTTVTCKSFLDSKDSMPLIVMWLTGFYTDEDDTPIIDLDKLKSDTQKLIEACTKDPSLELISAAESVFDK
jgi:acid stress chaperone HdeB